MIYNNSASEQWRNVFSVNDAESIGDADGKNKSCPIHISHKIHFQRYKSECERRTP